MNGKLNLLLLVLAVVQPSWLMAEIKVNALISSGGVLQQGMPVPIWGTAGKDEKITVKFAGQTVTAIATNGEWSVRLAPLKASVAPQTMLVSGANTLEFSNLLVGEVWICSGQSNMAFPLIESADGTNHAAAANDPLMRLFAVSYNPATELQKTLKGQWRECTSSNAAHFSAVGYFFGRDLRKALGGAPVGLIQTSVGGTAAEAWTQREVLENNPQLHEILDWQAKRMQDYQAALEKYNREEPALLEQWKADCARAKVGGKPQPSAPHAPFHPDRLCLAPCVLYNGMVAPLQPYAIKGVIWYQGESNDSRAKQYQTLFPAMVRDWRAAWQEGDFPFLFVQIAPQNGMSPEIREAQLICWQKIPSTAMTVTTDVGDANNIHPTHKEPVGARLARAARAIAYGEKIEYSGPVFESLQIDGDKAMLSFTHIGNGLMAKAGDLKGFTIADETLKFTPATATIQGDTVIAHSDKVARPVAVRYGWSKVPDVNLYNKDGLPATPFRTDLVP